MNYAVFQSGGKQYKVSEGNILEVEHLTGEPGQEVSFANVLLAVEEGGVQVGKPFLSGAMISAKILEHNKGPKIRVAKFKAKSRHRRVTGHRQQLTRVQITKISLGKKEKEKSKDK